VSTLTWADLMANPHLEDLPFNIEPNDMHIKAGLYLEAGAEEVRIVALDGERRVIHA
jgi:hypothetical protein